MARYSAASSLVPPGAMPLTKSLLFLIGASFLLGLFSPELGLGDWNSRLELATGELSQNYWTLLTYPLVTRSIFTLIFAGLWLWLIGGSLEADWGGRRYGWLWVALTLTTGLACWLLGEWQLARPAWISGLGIPLTGITWAWSSNRPRQEVWLWGLVPLQARWVAWLSAAIVFVIYFRIDPWYGLAVLTGIPVCYLFRPPGVGRGSSLRRWQQRWRERRRQRRLKKFRVVH